MDVEEKEDEEEKEEEGAPDQNPLSKFK